jgi:hypothetical protein
MTDDRDSLEAELRALRPPEPSPALRGRIAARLAAAPRAPRLPQWRVALVGGLAAAGLAFVLLLNRFAPRPHGPTVVDVLPRPASPAPPTLHAYSLALAKSPEALETLLDEQAVSSARAGAPAPVRAFVTSAPELLTWRGNHQ